MGTIWLTYGGLMWQGQFQVLKSPSRASATGPQSACYPSNKLHPPNDVKEGHVTLWHEFEITPERLLLVLI